MIQCSFIDIPAYSIKKLVFLVYWNFDPNKTVHRVFSSIQCLSIFRNIDASSHYHSYFSLFFRLSSVRIWAGKARTSIEGNPDGAERMETFSRLLAFREVLQILYAFCTSCSVCFSIRLFPFLFLLFLERFWSAGESHTDRHIPK